MVDFRHISCKFCSGSGSYTFSGVTVGGSGLYLGFLLLCGWFSLSQLFYCCESTRGLTVWLGNL
jgi:hypothetical protein